MNVSSLLNCVNMVFVRTPSDVEVRLFGSPNTSLSIAYLCKAAGILRRVLEFI